MTEEEEMWVAAIDWKAYQAEEVVTKEVAENENWEVVCQHNF